MTIHSPAERDRNTRVMNLIRHTLNSSDIADSRNQLPDTRKSGHWSLVTGIFERKEGYFKETENDQVMEKIDKAGNILGFSVLRVSQLRKKPLDVVLS